jgi:hypothetical protein
VGLLILARISAGPTILPHAQVGSSCSPHQQTEQAEAAGLRWFFEFVLSWIDLRFVYLTWSIPRIAAQAFFFGR